MFTHINKIKVSIWGRTIGTIVATTRTNSFAFAYDKDFLKSGIEIAPLGMPLSKKKILVSQFVKAINLE